MTNLKKFALLLLLYISATLVYSSDNQSMAGKFVAPYSKDTKVETITLTITINSLSKTQMQNVPIKGYLEVYSILGKREKRIKLDNCNGEISIDLPKGLYILKAEKVTQKIRVN